MTITPPPSADSPAPVPAPAPPTVPPGWYSDPASGLMRWWDGGKWTEHFQPAAKHTSGPMTAGQLNVKREVIYNRQQQGHSILLHLVLGIFILWINVIYISVSPNHYWHT